MFEVNLAITPPLTRIVLEGDLDTLEAQQLEDWFECHFHQFTDDIEVDLAGLDTLNSAGIHAFLRFDALLKAHDRDFRFTGVTSRLFHVFRYCELDFVFTFQYAIDAAGSPFSAPRSADRRS